MEPTNHQKHQAGRHLVVAYALLRGYAATIVDTHRYVEVNGHSAVVMLAGMGAWQIANVDDFTTANQQRYVLVDVTNGATDLYIVAGEELRRGVRERHDAFLVRVGGERPRNAESKHSTIKPVDVADWKNHWSLFD